MYSSLVKTTHILKFKPGDICFTLTINLLKLEYNSSDFSTKYVSLYLVRI